MGVGRTKGTLRGLEPRRLLNSSCAYLWWSSNQLDELSVSLGTPASWKAGDRQMFSTNEQSHASIYKTNPSSLLQFGVTAHRTKNVELRTLSLIVKLSLANNYTGERWEGFLLAQGKDIAVQGLDPATTEVARNNLNATSTSNHKPFWYTEVQCGYLARENGNCIVSLLQCQQ